MERRSSQATAAGGREQTEGFHRCLAHHDIGIVKVPTDGKPEADDG